MIEATCVTSDCAAEAGAQADVSFVLPDCPLELMRLADAALAKAASAPLAAVTEDNLLAVSRCSERLRRRQVGFDAQLLVEVNDRSAQEREGFVRILTWLSQGLRLGRSEAMRRYRHSQKIA